MPSIVVQHVKTDTRNGNLIYRRRVLQALKRHFPQSGIVKTLGRTTKAAQIAYGPFHGRIEHLLALAKNGVAGLSSAEQRECSGQTDQEQTCRAEAADMIIAPFQDAEPGQSGRPTISPSFSPSFKVRPILRDAA